MVAVAAVIFRLQRSFRPHTVCPIAVEDSKNSLGRGDAEVTLVKDTTSQVPPLQKNMTLLCADQPVPPRPASRLDTTHILTALSHSPASA